MPPHKRPKIEIISCILQIVLTSYVVQTQSDDCGEEVHMRPGQYSIFTVTKDDIVSYYGRSHECIRSFIPEQLDTHFEVDINYLKYATVSIDGYNDPQDTDFYKYSPTTTVEMKAYDNEQFNHMAIVVRVNRKSNRFIPDGTVAEVYVHLALNDHPREQTLTARSEEEYIVSPNYPFPYESARQSYIWHIQSTQPQVLVLRDMDVGTDDIGYCRNDKIVIADGSSTDTPYSQEYCGTESFLVLDTNGESSNGHCCETTVKLVISGTNQEGHSGFMITYKTVDEDEDDEGPGDSYGGDIRKSSGNSAGVAVGATIATVLLVLLFVAAAAVFVMRRRRLQSDRQQRRRRAFAQQLARGNRNPGDENGANSSVFIVGSLVINTQAPPPPYPGPPAPHDGNNNDENGGGAIYNSSGYYARPDGGYVNRHGQIVPSRGTGPSYSNEGFTGDNGDMEEPPPYHALMPGSPYGTEDHFYHPLATNGHSAAAQSNSSEYSVAQIPDTSGTIGSNGNTQIPDTSYSLAQRIDGERGLSADGQQQLPISPGAQGGAGQGYDSLATREESTRGGGEHSGEPRYAVPHSIEEPPAYEDSNPPHPPPAYEEALI